MSKPNGKPPIDRSAAEAETSVAAIAAAQDAPMPTVENDPPCLFVPGSGINSLDVFETALMFLVELTNSPVQFAPGQIRTIALSAHRTAQLSDSARRFMRPLAPPPSEQSASGHQTH